MLDDVAKIKKIDSQSMLDFISKFPEQVEEVYNRSKKMQVAPFKPTRIVVSGMGASAIGGDILASLLFRRIKIPVFRNMAFNLPMFVDGGTLLFAVSYSGNTLETLHTLEEGTNAGCRIIGITSGGKLKKECEKAGHMLISAPKGIPRRASVAYTFIPILAVLERLGIYDPEVVVRESVAVLKNMRDSLVPSVPTQDNEAKQIAMKLKDRVPAIYGHTFLSAIARRWHTQFNENAKVLSWYGTIPEMTHNEVAGWSRDSRAENCAAVFLRQEDEAPHLKTLVEKAEKAMKTEVVETWAQGGSELAKMLSTMYLGDFVSVYLAIANGTDPSPSATIGSG